MDIESAIKGRRSVRAFSGKNVERALIEEVLELSFESPSWSNIQPYRIAIADGELWQQLASEMFERSGKDIVSPEIAWPGEYPPPYKERRRATGFGLYGVLGIARDDHEARQAQFMKNFNGFGSPAAAFIFTDRRIGEYATLDVGCWLTTFMLAARARGLETIAQAALAGYPDIVRKYFDVPEGLALICGVAIGYPADDPVNNFRPERAPAKDILLNPK